MLINVVSDTRVASSSFGAAVIYRPLLDVSQSDELEFAKDTPVARKTILERISSGEKAAVEECIDAYASLIWSLARRFLRNEADAEDAVQDIFIALWSSASQYNPSIASEITFISTIARRRLIDRIRKAGRQPVTESIDNENNSHPQPAVASQLEQSAELEKVANVLDSMRPENRDILSMSLYEGYSHSEIAAHLELPLGTVKTKVRRGLMQIREQLQVNDDVAGDISG
jgi:RNA polymerase sigma factor (sigma-70 family)